MDDLVLDARATLAAQLARAVVGYSSGRLRALAWLSVATPALYERLGPLIREHAVHQSPGAGRALTQAIKALSLEDYMRRKAEGASRE